MGKSPGLGFVWWPLRVCDGESEFRCVESIDRANRIEMFAKLGICMTLSARSAGWQNDGTDHDVQVSALSFPSMI